MISSSRVLAGAAFAVAALTAAQANAGQKIVNGDFETGDFTGWTPSTELDSQGDLFVVPNNGGTTPLSGLPYQLNAVGGRFFALADQTGSGSYSLTQAFSVGPNGVGAVVSFQLFANNYVPGGATRPGRDFKTRTVQNVEVDILKGGADAFTNDPADIVAVLYGPGADAGANPNPWGDYSFNLPLTQGHYQIRFADTDNQNFLTMGVDNVSVLAVPEPGTWAMMLIGLAGIGLAVRRRSRSLASAA
jgi:hypothetical protein